MELGRLSPKTDLVEGKESNKIVWTLNRVFKTKVASETTRQHILKLDLQAAELESRYNEEVKLRKEAEEALAKEKKELEMTKVLLESYKEEQDRLQLQAKALEQRHENELRLRKDTEVVLSVELERIDKYKVRLVTMEAEHNDMIDKAHELESMYVNQLILKKALMKEHEELLEAYNRDVDINAYTVRQERDNALMLLEEIATKQMEESQPPSSFICPISQEVMKDPHLTADGHTYEAEAIKKWFARGHNTSPMTNLKLPHRNLVPNRALQSTIQELIPPS